MLNEKIIKRPKSGKPSLLRPLTVRQKIPFKTIYNEFNKPINNIVKNINSKNILNYDKIETKDSNNSNKDNILSSLENSKTKDTFNTLLSNELKNLDELNEKKEKLKNINLIEKDCDDLYEWSNLLNNSRPISSYTTLNKKTFNTNNEENKINEPNKPNKNRNIKKNIKHTIIECDNKQNQKQKSKNSIKKTHKIIRPMSVYSQRNNSSYFYFSKTINNYFKENLKTFSERIKIIKPKLKSNSYQLKHEIKNQRILSAKKELELNKRLNSEEEINLEKKNLIIAAERNNPIPLLQSIFKQVYPGEEIIKENIKMYYNTMKPFPNEDNRDPIDYTKNDRLRWIEEMKRNKMEKKLKYNKSDIENYNIDDRNLILSYYNNNDPYIQMFNRILDNKIKQNNDINNNNVKKDIIEKCYNPILQNVDYNFNTKNLIKEKNKNNINNQKNDEKKEEIIDKKETNNAFNNIRPKTGFKPVNSIINNPWAKRPLTSIRKNNNLYSNNDQYINDNSKELVINKNNNNNYDQLSDFEYSSCNSLPTKTLSNVGNISYDKINKMIQQKHLKSNGLKNKKYNEEQICIPKKRNYKKTLSFNKGYYSNRTIKNKENNKWNGYYNKNEINFYNFDDIFNNLLNKNKKNNNNNLYTLNYFKNIGGKFYSSSNNVNVKKRRNSKYKKINNLCTESRYSKDDPEVDYIDESVYCKINSSLQKI